MSLKNSSIQGSSYRVWVLLDTAFQPYPFVCDVFYDTLTLPSLESSTELTEIRNVTPNHSNVRTLNENPSLVAISVLRDTHNLISGIKPIDFTTLSCNQQERKKLTIGIDISSCVSGGDAAHSLITSSTLLIWAVSSSITVRYDLIKLCPTIPRERPSLDGSTSTRFHGDRVQREPGF